MALPPRPTWLEINLDAVVHNFHTARHSVDPHTAVMPVIKDDGYGVGAVAVAHALTRAGADGFGIALLQEAATLRQAGITQPLYLLTGIPPDGEETVASLELTPFISNLEQARRLSRVARNEVDVWLKVDTGMARLGVPPGQVAAAIDTLRNLPRLRLRGIASHLARADEPEHPATREQVARMVEVAALPAAAGLPLSLANSAGLLAHPAARFQRVRPGIMLYGASPFFPRRTWEEDGLRPVVSWRCRILQIQELPPHTPLGYGHTHTTRDHARIAWLPVGYGDGYCRSLGGRAEVLVRGRRAPVVGRVCMDLIAVDVTAIGGVTEGEVATLLGRDGEGFIGIEEMARWQETIPYEVITRIHPRVPRQGDSGH